MRATKKSINHHRELAIAVDWQDDVWQPRIEMLPEASRRRTAKNSDSWLPVVTGRIAPVRCNGLFFKPMKSILPGSHRHRAGFTLVELLTVIAIIGVLAAMVLAAMAGVRNKAKKVKAQLEMSQLVLAIQHYDSVYGRFPTSQSPNGDFTYGGTFHDTAGNVTGTLNTTPSSGVMMTNDEVVAILMNITNYPGGGPTVNSNYVKNPQQQVFLNAKSSSDTSSPGVGTDLVYRDPWGNPYVITMDLNYDEMCKDTFYSQKSVSQQSGGTGYFGLIDSTDSTGADNNFEDRGKVMVWSAGPDCKFDSGATANQGVNKDNVLSWK
jgi:prepilin-type N-terminal cleavage/methylation domain-containing protein